MRRAFIGLRLLTVDEYDIKWTVATIPGNKASKTEDVVQIAEKPQWRTPRVNSSFLTCLKRKIVIDQDSKWAKYRSIGVSTCLLPIIKTSSNSGCETINGPQIKEYGLTKVIKNHRLIEFFKLLYISKLASQNNGMSKTTIKVDIYGYRHPYFLPMSVHFGYLTLQHSCWDNGPAIFIGGRSTYHTIGGQNYSR